MNRRGFLTLLAAPAVIRVASLMPVRTPIVTSPDLVLNFTPGESVLYKERFSRSELSDHLADAMRYSMHGLSPRTVLYAERQMAKVMKMDMKLATIMPEAWPLRLRDNRGDTVKFRRPPVFGESPVESLHRAMDSMAADYRRLLAEAEKTFKLG